VLLISAKDEDFLVSEKEIRVPALQTPVNGRTMTMEASNKASPIPMNVSSSGRKSSLVQIRPDIVNRRTEMVVNAVGGRGLGDFHSLGRPG